MHVVRAYLSFYYIHAFPCTQCSQDFPYFQSFLFKKYFSPIFWREHYAILAIPFCMCYTFCDVICFIHLIVLRFCFLSQLPGHDFIIQNRSFFVYYSPVNLYRTTPLWRGFTIQKTLLTFQESFLLSFHYSHSIVPQGFGVKS